MRVSLFILTVSLLQGCQCFWVTEVYQDGIDHVADWEPHYERFYDPTLDVSRIGQPDWCASPLNRWWCGKKCHACQMPPIAVYHNAVYPGDQIGTPPKSTQHPAEPVPGTPGVPPAPAILEISPEPTEAPTPPAVLPNAPATQLNNLPAPPNPMPFPGQTAPEAVSPAPAATAPQVTEPSPVIEQLTHRSQAVSGSPPSPRNSAWDAAKKRSSKLTPQVVPSLHEEAMPTPAATGASEANPQTGTVIPAVEEFKPTPQWKPAPAESGAEPRQIRPAPEWTRPRAAYNETSALGLSRDAGD